MPTKEITQVTLSIREITQNGYVKIEFNQPLVVPPFTQAVKGQSFVNSENQVVYNNTSNKQVDEWALETFGGYGSTQGGRQMLALNELNVTRDVLKFEYNLRSDVDPKDVRFDL